MNLHLQMIPNEIQMKIFSYLQTPVAKLIQDEYDVYENDSYTDFYTEYGSPCNLTSSECISFSDYYFEKLYDPHSFNSYLYKEIIIQKSQNARKKLHR